MGWVNCVFHPICSTRRRAEANTHCQIRFSRPLSRPHATQPDPQVSCGTAWDPRLVRLRRPIRRLLWAGWMCIPFCVKSTTGRGAPARLFREFTGKCHPANPTSGCGVHTSEGPGGCDAVAARRRGLADPPGFRRNECVRSEWDKLAGGTSTACGGDLLSRDNHALHHSLGRDPPCSTRRLSGGMSRAARRGCGRAVKASGEDLSPRIRVRQRCRFASWLFKVRRAQRRRSGRERTPGTRRNEPPRPTKAVLAAIQPWEATRQLSSVLRGS